MRHSLFNDAEQQRWVNEVANALLAQTEQHRKVAEAMQGMSDLLTALEVRVAALEARAGETAPPTGSEWSSWIRGPRA